MHVLVTGMNGFTGRYLQQELETHGYTVSGLKSNLLHRQNLFDEIAAVKPDYVIHLAGITYVGHKEPIDFYQVNVIGSFNLLEALEKQKQYLRNIMFVSSANVYGNSRKSILTEHSVTTPANDYGISKLTMENMAKLWCNKLPIFITRPFNYTGVGQSEVFLIPKIVSHFKNKIPSIELGNVNVAREFGDVRVVVDIYRRLIEASPIGETINVCTNQAYTIRDVIKIAEKISNHKIKIYVNKNFMRKNEVKVLKGANAHLMRIIKNWKTISFEETLEWMLKS